MPAYIAPEETLATTRRRREERERLLAEKTRPAGEASECERQLRAELHRQLALPVLADALAGVVFDHLEGNRGRPIVRDQLAAALLVRLQRSGLARDPRFQRPP